MRPFGLLGFAAAMAALGACASARETARTDAQLSGQVFTDAPAAPALPPAQPARAALSPFETVRAALPTFDLQDARDRGGISVARDVAFPAESAILSRHEVERLTPLQAYLRANPATAVRIEGHGDGRVTGQAARDQDADLSQSRAQAVARALLTDMHISTDRITAAPGGASTPAQTGRAEIILVVSP